MPVFLVFTIWQGITVYSSYQNTNITSEDNVLGGGRMDPPDLDNMMADSLGFSVLEWIFNPEILTI